MPSLLYDDRIYVSAVQWAIVPKGTVYLALPMDSDRPREIRGTTVVTPVTPVPSNLMGSIPPRSLLRAACLGARWGIATGRSRTRGMAHAPRDVAQGRCLERHTEMPLSNNAIVVIFLTGYVIAWVIGETMGGWRGALTEIGVIIAIGTVLCFACRNDD